MRWPWSNSSDADDRDKRPPVRWNRILNATDWSHYTEPRTVIPTVLLTCTTLALVHIYRLYLRRIPNSEYITPRFFGRRSLFGRVTSVGDGDGFRLFHTPGGRLAGWEWLPWKRIPTRREDLVAKTISIRIAGVDAPELAHFGKPAQPYGEEALRWLRSYILHRRVRAFPHRRDQYGRIVATVFVRRGVVPRNVGLEMLRRGLATVYEASAGAEFGGFERQYRGAENEAKRKRVGMWSKPSIFARMIGEKEEPLESPRQFKARMNALDGGARRSRRAKRAAAPPK